MLRQFTTPPYSVYDEFVNRNPHSGQDMPGVTNGSVYSTEDEEVSSKLDFMVCLDYHKSGDDYYNLLYCGGGIVILLLAIINTVLFSVILYYHLKKHGF